MKRLLVLALVLGSLAPVAQTRTLPAVNSDPSPDKSAPAGMGEVTIPSHGSNLNGLVYIAQGAAPHPVVILLHGFPGYEQNLDLAQSIRRAGWDVVFFHYRGSWGSQGDFSFSNAQDDVDSAIAWVRVPDNAQRYRMDPQRIVVIGHSMGGFMAASGAARDPKVLGLAMISGWNIGATARDEKIFSLWRSNAVREMGPLRGCTPDSLREEIKSNQERLDYDNFASALRTRSVLVITSNDHLQGAGDAFVAAVKKAGSTRVTSMHMDTDHPYSDHRIALQNAVIEWLSNF